MKDSLIDNIAHIGNQKNPPTDKTTGKQPYKACGNDKNKERQNSLEIREKNGNGYLIPYGQITLTQYTSHQIVSLFCADYVCNIEGKNLGSIITLLQDSRVRYIQEFDQNRFIEAGSDEAVVHKITVEFGGENRKRNDSA